MFYWHKGNPGSLISLISCAVFQVLTLPWFLSCSIYPLSSSDTVYHPRMLWSSAPPRIVLKCEGWAGECRALSGNLVCTWEIDECRCLHVPHGLIMYILSSLCCSPRARLHFQSVAKGFPSNPGSLPHLLLSPLLRRPQLFGSILITLSLWWNNPSPSHSLAHWL